MLGLVDSPIGGLKIVEVLAWRPGIDERITKDLLAIGEVPVANRFSVLDVPPYPIDVPGWIPPMDSEDIP